MAIQSLVLFRIDRFSEAKGVIQSEPHVPRGCREHETLPAFTKLEIKNKKVAGKYLEAEITHREGMPVTGYWHDEPIREVISENIFRAYYNVERKVFIVAAPHAEASVAIKRLNKDRSDDVKLTRVRVDFNTILEKTPKVSILGAWVKSPDATIRSRAAFAGADLRKQKEFEQMCKGGKLSSLSLSYPFPTEDEAFRVNISRWCSAFFLGNVELKKGLQFMEHLAAFEAKRESAQRGSKKARR